MEILIIYSNLYIRNIFYFYMRFYLLLICGGICEGIMNYLFCLIDKNVGSLDK